MSQWRKEIGRKGASRLQEKLAADPAALEAWKAAQRKGMLRPSVRAHNRAEGLRQGADPAIQAKKRAAQMRNMADPVKRAAQVARSRRAVQKLDPEFLREKMRQRMADPVFRAKAAEGRRRAMADPEGQARRAAAKAAREADPEWRRFQSERIRATWEAPGQRDKRRRALAAAAQRRREAKVLEQEAKASVRKVAPVEVPVWVTRAGLRDDYLDVARDHGEEEAAAHCRRLKREAEAA